MSERESMKRGTIKAIHLQGGIAVLYIESDGKISRLFGDNGPTVRALDSVLGNGVIAPGHLLDEDKVVGQEIGFIADDEGMLICIDR